MLIFTLKGNQMPEFFLVLVLLAQNPIMTTMPKPYAESQCELAGRNWIKIKDAYMRVYYCIPANGHVK